MKRIDDITERLEQGVKEVFDSENYKAYLNTVSKFYNYSTNNCLLITMQYPEATMVAGYQAWKTKFKRQVRKGEKAIKILAPCPHKRVVEKDGEEKEITWITYRTTNVFDIQQTEGEELPTICKRLKGSVDDYSTLKGNIIQISPVPVVFENIKGRAAGYYHTETKDIHISDKLSEQQTIKTLLHEIAHAKLHNKENGKEKEADRRTKEVQAESIAYTVCQWLGIDTSTYSFEYIASWASGKEAKELSESMEVVRATSKEMIECFAT